MNPRIVNQSRQADDSFAIAAIGPLELPLFVLVPPGGSAFVTDFGGLNPIERDTAGFAAAAGFFISAPAIPFVLNTYQYYVPGLFAGYAARLSAPEPIGAIERVDFTYPITGKYIAFEIANPSPAPIVVAGVIRLRPVSCYDQQNISVVLDPTDVVTVRFEKGGTILYYNGNPGGVNTPMFAANANRIEFFGVNLGPRPIDINLGAPAVFGTGQIVPANTPFRYDRESGLAVNFIDDGGAGGALVSATEISRP